MRVLSSAISAFSSPSPTQRTGVDVNPETLKQMGELAFHALQQVGHVVNTDTPAIRNMTSLYAAFLSSAVAFTGYRTFIRQKPAILEKRVNLPVLDQKSELEDPIADVFGVLEVVATKCQHFVQDASLHYANTIQQARAAQDAKRAIRSMVVREKESTEFGTGSTNKSGIDLSTLYVLGLNATPLFPERNRLANWRANALQGTWFELWAVQQRDKRIRELPVLRRDQPNIRELAKFEKAVKPIRRLNLEGVKAPYGEWRNWNTPYANLRKMDAYGKKFTWNDFTGANLSEAKLGTSKWFFNDIRETNLQGAELFNTRFARVDARKADFSPYVENALEPENNVIRATNLEGVHMNVTDYEPLLTNEWYNVENNFQEAKFQGANLKNSFIQQANFEKARFHAPFYEDIQNVKNAKGKPVNQYTLYKPEQNVWVGKEPLRAADFTGSTWGDVNASGIQAQGVTFEDMRFMDSIPEAVSGELGKDHPVTFRIEKECPVVSFKNAKLQNSTWKGTELLQVNADKEVLENAKPAVSFKQANLSGADFSQATIEGKMLQNIIQEALHGTSSDTKSLKLVFKKTKWKKGGNPFATVSPYSHAYSDTLTKKLLTE
jgi:uncharacterized protein YjbI with pentapeptide repeats